MISALGTDQKPHVVVTLLKRVNLGVGADVIVEIQLVEVRPPDPNELDCVVHSDYGLFFGFAHGLTVNSNGKTNLGSGGLPPTVIVDHPEFPEHGWCGDLVARVVVDPTAIYLIIQSFG